MALTTGTQGWSPNLGSIGAFALGRCKVRRPAILPEHLADVAMAANMVIAKWSLDQANLWAVDLLNVPLVQGTATYTLPATVLLLLDAYISVPAGSAVQDRIVSSISRTTYASFPNKTHQAFPSSFWFDRTEPPSVTLYPTPDGTMSYTLKYYAIIRSDDSAVAGAKTLDLPYRMLPAFADALAAELALTYSPESFQVLDQVAERSFKRARDQESEDVPLFVIPGLSSYYRR